MHFIESSGNKLSFIFGSISIFGAAINQVGSLLISPNNANTSKNNIENIVAIDFTVKNERTEKYNGN